MIVHSEIISFLAVKGLHLYRRESQILEFKEQFNFAGLADYFRDFAAFANNRGGYLIFGVTDSPRTASGLSDRALDQFSKLDPEAITGYILENFSTDIYWDSAIVEHEGKYFGAFKVEEAKSKPIIARKDLGTNQTLQNGSIYYRYGGRTQKIQSAELESIINKRIERTNKDWIDHVTEIGSSGPREAFVFRANSKIEHTRNGAFIVDEELAKKLKFVREGHFTENGGAAALKLVGDIVPVDTLEVERIIEEDLFKKYPLSATELANEVVKTGRGVSKNSVWTAIADNNMKTNSDYSVYNFRNKKQKTDYENSGKLSSVTSSIYSVQALSFLQNLFKN
ncbi:helix-turn-helix domain-containing protein [Falsihalocynthiibacter sp. BN13B15]|uniref:AlbA family DNA-binding domain-containing protein n=1 Tax=Falsihalocynthiibacter sp. BN13B15 TaxID=3240871 RepID=UPI0035106438